MGRISLIIIVLALSHLTPEVNGQDSLPTSDRKAPQKILLHFDKPSYYPGDTVFFKAYLYADYGPDLNASNLLVGLYNSAGKKLAEKRFPVFGGSCYGNIELTDSMEHGLYYFQAITPEQLLQKDSIGYIRQVFVFNPRRVPSYLTKVDEKEYLVRFFPQGGELVEGFSNQVLFTATDQYGNPAPVKGKLLDEKQNVLTEFDAAEGKGSFFLFPEMKTYSVSIRFPNEREKLYFLPPVRSKGTVFRIDGNGEEKKYLISISDDIDRNGLKLLGVMNGRPVLQLPLEAAGNEFTGIIPNLKLPSGILFLALRDSRGNILAENHCLIDNKEYRKTAELQIDSLDLREGGINVLRVDFKDSVWANLSLSVIDPERAEPMFGIGSNVIEDALYNNEKLGPNGEPRRVDWKKIFSDSVLQQPYLEDFIHISGKVFKEGTSKLVPGGGQLNFMVTTKDSVNTFLFTTVDSSGEFILNNLVFADTARFSFAMSKGKSGSRTVSIMLDDPRYRMPAGLPLVPALPQLYFDKIFIADTTSANRFASWYDSLLRGSDKYKLLEEAKVYATVKKRNPTLLVNEQYTSGLFSAMGLVKVMDLINDPARGGGNIFDYISSKMAGVRVTRLNGWTYRISSNRRPSMGSIMAAGDNPETLFFLDEREVTSSEISIIPLAAIALVKYFPPGTSQLAFSGATGVLAVYTKQDADSYGNFDVMSSFRYPGYAPSDLLYDDAYNQYHKSRSGTVYWKPDILLSGESNKLILRFINPAPARSFRILLQGVTHDGEFIYLEKTISAK